MKHYDNHQIEEALYQEGYQFIAGCDEVGRGPLIGPVTAAAVIMPRNCYIEGVTDSKKVSAKNRLILSEEIKKQALSYAVIFIDNKTIDKINILEASRLAMQKAVKSLKVVPDIIIADAMDLKIDIQTRPIIKGDAKSFTIACASILAKVERDAYMMKLATKYPEFDLEHNMGYPTKKHLDALKEYGYTVLHRKSFGPVKKEVNKSNKYQKKK